MAVKTAFEPTKSVRFVGWFKMTGGDCTVSNALELVADQIDWLPAPGNTPRW